MGSNTKRICLWSGPRNVSTALMYSFAQRPDTRVYDEPLYAYYLRNSDAKTYHPGAEEIMDQMENDGNQVVQNMLSDTSKPVLFFKHMTHHLLDLDTSFMKQMSHIILTRHPKEMLLSYSKVIHEPTMKDLGYEDHIKLWQILENMDKDVTILDSAKLLQNPAHVLAELCNKLDITFFSSMLSWPKMKRPEDGIWAKYWYKNVHNSTGFKPYTPNSNPLPAHLRDLYKSCLPLYEKLEKFALK